MDYREQYRKRVEEEERSAQIRRAKRKKEKKIKDLKTTQKLKSLKEHSSGLITWKQKENSYIWDGYVGEDKLFKISQGIYKYTLSVYQDTENKNSTTAKMHSTAFDLNKLESKAELIVKGIINKIGQED